MPNITIYLTEEVYDRFIALDDEQQREARLKAINTIEKYIQKGVVSNE